MFLLRTLHHVSRFTNNELMNHAFLYIRDIWSTFHKYVLELFAVIAYFSLTHDDTQSMQCIFNALLNFLSRYAIVILGLVNVCIQTGFSRN